MLSNASPCSLALCLHFLSAASGEAGRTKATLRNRQRHLCMPQRYCNIVRNLKRCMAVKKKNSKTYKIWIEKYIGRYDSNYIRTQHGVRLAFFIKMTYHSGAFPTRW